ncbi:glycolate oxidase subunit GlcE [Kiloniella sp.]|uniref:glycolate oxidase subunit GlcE n=1 Tax=Kiloniella sp. TaxID=1938587 RepID=UPI003B011260
MSHIKPDNAAQLEEAVQWALAQEETLEVLGAGSKKSLGRKITCDHQLDLSGLTGITLYEPEELVLSARAGTPLSEIEAALAEHNQYMAFEPLDYGPLFSGQPNSDNTNSGTIGGAIACNLSGPRRIKSGAARDHFLGFSAVSGRGETFKSGGRVVKNVTGYDLMKLMAGSFGTLGVMSDITIKVLPAPNEEKTYLLHGLDDDRAMEAMKQALNSSCEISSAAHIPQALAATLELLPSDQATTALRLEGHGPSVSYRVAKLEALLKDFGNGQLIDLSDSRALWRELRDGAPLAGNSDHSVWRISVPPKSGSAYIDSLNLGSDTRYFYDWGGGLIWLSFPGGDNATLLRNALEGITGHATLLTSPEGASDQDVPNHPLGTGEHMLMRRVKENFDPKAILNPGRLYGDLPGRMFGDI